MTILSQRQHLAYRLLRDIAPELDQWPIEGLAELAARYGLGKVDPVQIRIAREREQATSAQW